ncbi:MAG: hypothetical protein HWN65_07895, partial [Candidatus Helarchaeota archaeon]|nr:hypothetical protein [Candidatus Helarchaeota archaeon]
MRTSSPARHYFGAARTCSESEKALPHGWNKGGSIPQRSPLKGFSPKHAA